MRAPLILLSAAALHGCAACVQPSLPSDGNDGDADQPDQPDITDGEDGGRDTSPIPPCEQPEDEPNDNAGDAQVLEMGSWACGVIDRAGDGEFFEVTTIEDGWIRVWTRAAEIGSTADITLAVTGDPFPNASGTGEIVPTAVSTRIPSSTDGRLVLPTEADETWQINFVDAAGSFSDTHEWELIANMTKDPVECDRWEAEDRFAERDAENDTNSELETAEPIEPGTTTCGYISLDTDVDVFVMDLPEGKSLIQARIVAWNEGSPLNSNLSLYGPAGNRNALENSGEYGSDLDPILEFTTSRGGLWYLRVAPDNDAGWMSWYQLEVTVETSVDDTGVAGTDAAGGTDG